MALRPERPAPRAPRAPRRSTRVCLHVCTWVAAQLDAACGSRPPPLRARPQIDERLNGDGTGLPFGINDPALGWIILVVPFLVWILYYIGQKDFGDFEDPDSGVGL